MTVVRIRPSVVEGRTVAPPSKSYTHRFLLAAHLSGRRARVVRPLQSDDTVRTARGLGPLGSHVVRTRGVWTVTPRPIRTSAALRTVDCGESGTTLRLLTAIAARQEGPTRFVGSGRLPRRPMAPLFEALSALGAKVETAGPTRALPFQISGPIHGGNVALAVDTSSQFTSALLLALPTLPEDSRLRTRGRPVSEPYVAATLAVLDRCGIEVGVRRSGFQIPGGQRFRPVPRPVPGDASSAAYLWVAAALTGGHVTVEGVPPAWPQADLAILELLRRAGSEVRRRGDEVTVAAGDRRRPFRAELTDSPDLYPLAGVLAAATPGRSELRGAPQVVAKESDRRQETARLARAMGATVRSSPGGLVIEGSGQPRRLRLRGLADHRLVMSAAVAAVAADGASEIADASAVSKSFPDFFAALRTLGGEVGPR